MNSVEALVQYQSRKINSNELVMALDRDVQRISRHFAIVFRVPDSKDDIAQELFITLTSRNAADKYDPSLPLDKYLETITYRIANHISRPGRRLDSFSQFVNGEHVGMDEGIEISMKYADPSVIHEDVDVIDHEIDHDKAIQQFDALLKKSGLGNDEIPYNLWAVKSTNDPVSDDIIPALRKFKHCDALQTEKIVAWYREFSTIERLQDNVLYHPWRLAECVVLTRSLRDELVATDPDQKGKAIQLFVKGESHLRLSGIMNELGLQRVELANLIGIPPPRLASYLDAHVLVVPDKIMRKAEDIYHSMEERRLRVIEYATKPMSEIMMAWLTQYHLSDADLCEKLSISARTIKRWRLDQNKPSIARILGYETILASTPPY